MNGETRYYARPELAHRLVLSPRGEVPFDDGPDGVFLAAPRRTGKTTFPRRELVPALENSGTTVVYVDLWAEETRDPDAAAIAFYRERLAEPASARKLDAQSVRTALRKLRRGTPSLVRKSARGEYAPEDSGMHGGYDELNRTGRWPPGRNS